MGSSHSPEGWIEEVEGVGIGNLPEGCISHALSLTSPVDTCRSAATARVFRLAAESDEVWEGFLPSDYREILSRAVDPLVCTTKKELYFRLCEPILIDGGKKSLVLEKSTGKKCFMLSARELSIIWGDTPDYWTWISLPESRFTEVAKLVDVCWLEINGKINTAMLSHKTTYVAYLVFKLTPSHAGFEHPSQEASITMGANSSQEAVSLFYHHPSNANIYEEDWIMFRRGWRGRFLPEEVESMDPNIKQVPCRRVDGWMEIALGEFFNDEGDDGEVKMTLKEIKGGHWKSGLVVRGIEVRPKILLV